MLDIAGKTKTTMDNSSETAYSAIRTMFYHRIPAGKDKESAAAEIQTTVYACWGRIKA